MSNSTYFAVSSVGKDRWYWVVWPSMQWQVDPTVSHLQDGYVPTKADAVDLALDAAGMNGVWMEAKYAREYHRAKAAPASKQRSAAPSVVEYLHRDVYDPVTGAWHSVRHRITRKTPKFVFVEATSVDLRDGVSGNDSGDGPTSYRLDREFLEKNGYVFMPVIDALVDDPLFFTVPLQERMTRRGEDSTDCFAILELEPPCSVDDVKRAYRQLAKRLHPDQGGDQVQFLALQVAYKEALRLVGVTSP